MNENFLGNDGVKAICEALIENTTLKEVNLQANSIDKVGANAICQTLKLNKTITSISSDLTRLACKQNRK